MRAIPLDWGTVKSVCEETAARAADLIRSAPTPDAQVPGLDWTVAEVAAHLVSLTHRYEPFVQDISRAAFESMPELNAEELAPLAGRSLVQLADDLQRGTDALLALCPSGDAPARFFDMESDCALAIALHVEELVLHSVDIARATGTHWSVSPREALVAIAGTLQVLPKFVNVLRVPVGVCLAFRRRRPGVLAPVQTLETGLGELLRPPRHRRLATAPIDVRPRPESSHCAAPRARPRASRRRYGSACVPSRLLVTNYDFQVSKKF